MSVGDFYGEARLLDHILHPLTDNVAIGVVRYDHLKAKLSEECLPQREQLVEVQGSNDAHRLAIRRIRTILGIGGHQGFVPLIKKPGDC